MKMVYPSIMINDARFVESVLSANNIPCLVKNDVLQSVNSTIAAFWPEVWVLADDDAERAQSLITTKPNALVPVGWTCTDCGESIDGEFDACWKCGAEKPDAVYSAMN